MSDHDIHTLYCDLDAVFERIANQDRENVANLRSAFQMMADMGYTADEAKEEFTRFQAQYNADHNLNRSQQPRRHAKVLHSRPTTKRGMSGVQRFNRAFSLCVVAIPLLFMVGVVTELFFYSNCWYRTYLTVRYIKAVLYIIIWSRLMHTCLPTLVTKMVSVFFCFAGLGLAITHESAAHAWGVSLFGGGWNQFWLNIQWAYWGILTFTYLYAWLRLVHGPRYWILKYGAN